MNSSPDWRKILHDITWNVRGRVSSLITKRGTMNQYKFKDILDQQAQEAIIEVIKGNRIPVKLVSEEGDLEFNGDQYVITADPVDGTTNLSRGLHPSVTSISVAANPNQNDVIAGIVTDLYTGETYFAIKDEGATRDGYPIKPAEPIEYRRGLISMDISKVPQPKRLAPLIKNALHIRSEGCCAMSLCRVASGIFDAHVDLRGIVRATDVSAGLIILKEAGGVYAINSERGGGFTLNKDTRVELIAASGVEMIEQIDRILKKK